jgi:branched-chain amino acid transport system substrate-binding protein
MGFERRHTEHVNDVGSGKDLPVDARLILSLAMALVLAACSQGAAPANPVTGEKSNKTAAVKIGVLQSQTGPFASYGEVIMGGDKVAIRDINADGFVVGDTHYTFDPVYADSASDPTKASAGAIQLIRDDGVKFLFGPTETPARAAVQSQTSQARVIWFSSATALADDLEVQGGNTPDNMYAFNTGSSVLVQAEGAAAGAKKFFPDAKSVAMLSSNLSSYDSYTAAFPRAFNDAGFSLPPENFIRYDPSVKDFTPLLTRIKAIHPDILIVGQSTDVVTAVAKQMVDLGDVAGALFATAGDANIATNGATGSPLPFPFMYYAFGSQDPNNPTPDMTVFLKAYTDVNGKAPPVSTAAFAPSDVPALKLLIAAMQSVGSVSDTDAIARAMIGGQVSAPLGQFHFTANHVARQPETECLVNNGQNSCIVIPPPPD